MSYYHQPQPAQNSVKALIWNLSYIYKDQVEQKCSELMSHTSINQATVEVYTHSNGAQQTLLKIKGLLPITYRSATYYIPVSFWIPYQFPERPPMCYVVPTEKMDIKPSHKHMNKQGFIFHPYLSNWNNYRSSLIVLQTNLQSVFGKDPPVFAKQNVSRPVAIQPSSYSRAEEPPSYHNAFNANALNAYNRSINQAQPAARGGPYAQPGARPGNYVKPPSYPGPGSSQPGAANFNQPAPPSYNEISKANTGPPSYNQVAAMGQGPGLAVQHRASANEKDQLTKQVKSLLHDELTKLHTRWVKEVNELQRMETNLQRSKHEIETEEKAIEQQTNDFKNLKGELETANATIETWLDENKDSPPIDLLTTVEPQNVWSKQLIQAVAQDSAIDDTLYCLDRALGEDAINFKNYLKQVRKLTREQFFKRALTQKILEKQRQFREQSERSAHYQPWNNVLS